MQLRIASTFHADAGTLTELDGDDEEEEACKLEAGLVSLALLVSPVFL
jgi:hypothetical protein